MAQDKYLINYYKNNNLVIEDLSFKKRILVRIIILAICSILYLVMLAFSNQTKFKGEIPLSQMIMPLKVIMIITIILTILGIAFFTYLKISQNKLRLSLKFKRIIFTILDWFSILPICVVIVSFCFSYLFIITPISGNSMEPNIVDGEHVFVSYNQKIERFSVVVLEVNPKDNIDITENSYYIKRIIGLPGDTVTWKDNILTINGNKIDEYYFPQDYFGYFDNTRPYVEPDENGNLFQYQIYENGQKKIIKCQTIPEGYYFVMGDNRGHSSDSRSIGLIPAKNILGVALYHMNFIIPKGKIE